MIEGIPMSVIQNYNPDFPMEVRKANQFFTEWLLMAKGDPKELEGFPTRCWPGFNRAFGGARSELVTITGETGRGKTTFALNWLKDTLDQNRNSLLVSLENGPKDSFDSLGRMVLGRKPYETTEEEHKTWGQTLDRWPLWYLDHEGTLKSEMLLRLIHFAANAKGIRFIVVDHLDYIEKEWVYGKNESYVIGDCIRGIAAMAKRCNCTVVLICHPRNSGGDKTKKTKELGLDDLKGSSSIKQESSSVLILHRPSWEKKEAWLRFAKIRSLDFSKSVGGKIEYYFDNDRKKYEEFNGSLVWGENND